MNFDGNELNQNIQGPELSSIPIQREKILEILKSLNVSKACGIDGIGNNVLKKCANSLVEPICILASASLESECFSAAWKQANVVPVYKKNKKIKAASPIIDRFLFNPVHQKSLSVWFITNYYMRTDRNSIY